MWHHRDMTATDKRQQAARNRLTELSTAYAEAEKLLATAREALSAEIVSVLKARTLGPSEVTRLVPFERQHVGRIATAGGVPPLRDRTVVSAKKATPAAPMRSEVREPPSAPAAREQALIAALTDQQAAEVAARAYATADPKQYALLDSAAADGDRAVVAAGVGCGLLSETDIRLA